MSSSPVMVFETLAPHIDKVSRVEEVQAALTASIREHEPDTLSYCYYKTDVYKEAGPGLVNVIVIIR
jgi:hypothetical protein